MKTKKNKYICLGFNVNKRCGYVTGLAMMHDLFLHILKEHGYQVKSISLNSHFANKGVIGTPGFFRYFEYLSIICSVLVEFVKNRHAVFYFNPSTNRAGFYRDVLMVALAKFFNHKVLMQQFGALFESFKNSLSANSQNLLSWAYNKADIIIVEGEYAKEQYSFITNQDKLRIIQNGLPELSKSIQKQSKHFNPTDTFILFFMNNMIESKGYLDVLKAIDIIVNSKKIDVVCIFAGQFLASRDDEYFKSKDEAKLWFDNFVSLHNLKNNVTYFESVFDKKKESIFKKSHAFLLPSYYSFEGQPTAILEALSYGCVPIVTKYRLIPDMVDESCGIFVNKKAPNEIADAVEFLVSHPDRYKELSNNGFMRFYERFTQQAYAEKIISVIESL